MASKKINHICLLEKITFRWAGLFLWFTMTPAYSCYFYSSLWAEQMADDMFITEL